MTYSIACQRVTMLTRLPTFAFPATAPTLRIVQRLDQLRHRVGREQRVRIETDHDLAARVREPVVQRARLAAVRLAEHAHLRMIAVRGARDLVRVVRRSIVDDHDLELARILLRDQRLDRAQNDFLLAIRRHDHAHRWREGDRRIAILVILHALNDREHRHEHEAREAQEDREEEDPVEQPLHERSAFPTRSAHPRARAGFAAADPGIA